MIGSAEQCAEKLRALEAVGVDQFNVYLMTNAQEETLEAYGRDMIPRLRGRLAAALTQRAAGGGEVGRRLSSVHSHAPAAG